MTPHLRYLRDVREKHGFSQEDLAKELDVSRPTYLLIEKGERDMTVKEATKLAAIYGITLDELIRGNAPKRESPLPFLPEDQKQRSRVSKPKRDMRKFREVLLYILEKVGAKKNIGETALYKILYFIDFDFYEKFEEQFIGATYIKNHYGPTPLEFRDLVKDMQQKKEILLIKSKYFDFDQKKYLPLRKPDLSKFSALELEHVDFELRRLSDMNGSELREYSHGDLPWKVYEFGEKISYEVVFYRDDPYSQRSYDDDPL